MPADRANFASRRNDHGVSGRNNSAYWSDNIGPRRDDHGSGVVVAGTEHAAVAAEAASFAGVGWRKRRNAHGGDKDSEHKIFGHGAPPSKSITA
jgi:hypothetical protein